MDRVVVEGAMATPDGAWRVEAVRVLPGSTHWYRVWHGSTLHDRLTIGMVRDLLAAAGVDLAALVEVEP